MASVPTGGSMATPALIGAGGQVASAAIGSYGGKKAAQAQERSNAAALAYTKQKDAQTRQDALRHEGLWQTQQNQWRNAANQALANWGFQGTLEPISGYGMGSTVAPGGQAIPRGSAQARRPSPYADAVQPQEDDRYANSAWNDWRRYGLE